jgi:hypothetical protein
MFVFVYFVVDQIEEMNIYLIQDFRHHHHRRLVFHLMVDRKHYHRFVERQVELLIDLNQGQIFL